MVPPAGFEPTLLAPEASTLSTELRGHGNSTIPGTKPGRQGVGGARAPSPDLTLRNHARPPMLLGVPLMAVQQAQRGWLEGRGNLPADTSEKHLTYRGAVNMINAPFEGVLTEK